MHSPTADSFIFKKNNNQKSFPSLYLNFCGICKKPTATRNCLLQEQFLGAILLHF